MKESRPQDNMKDVMKIWGEDPQPQDKKSQSQVTSKVFKAEFQGIFLYGRKMRVYKNEKRKEMDVYLDNLKENILWFSTKTKAFLVDLYFANICLSEAEELADKEANKYFMIKHF